MMGTSSLKMTLHADIVNIANQELSADLPDD